MQYKLYQFAYEVLFTAAMGILVCFTYLLYGRWYFFRLIAGLDLRIYSMVKPFSASTCSTLLTLFS